ncbi:hypothetical protein NDU88_002405 [Pleurodeles waltl]|uniref:Uncharacterized protein n=1 Tax=Pleurodeles waltl TaxID=8319 RepID=A0AAV7NDW9_PLEWA|nr:hypothetical protein NDU88_002405 [Pleurodeles waltl]
MARSRATRDREENVQGGPRPGGPDEPDGGESEVMLGEARKKCTIVKQKLRQLNIQYTMLYPARLKITHNDRSMTFTAPQQVHDYIKRIRRKDDSRTPEEGLTDSPSTLSDPE